jgi:hypothetical protein
MSAATGATRVPPRSTRPASLAPGFLGGYSRPARVRHRRAPGLPWCVEQRLDGLCCVARHRYGVKPLCLAASIR